MQYKAIQDTKTEFPAIVKNNQIMCYNKNRTEGNKMILYHGSNVEVKNPQILISKRLLDFGTGFYTTSDFEQARKWAVRSAKIREIGKPIVSVYELDDSCFKSLKVLNFKSADKDWLHYICNHRKNQNVTDDDYDLVTGPVANDQTFRTVNNFIDGYLTEEIALQLLLPQKLKDQYTFKTEKALNFLHFTEVIK